MNATVHDRIRASVQETFRSGVFTVAFQAMATRCQVIFAADPATAKAFTRAAVNWVADFEARYSRFIPESLVSEINRQAGRAWVPTDPETDRLLALCHEAHFLTRGIFDPTALPLIQLWNWKATPPVIPSDDAIAAALKKTGWRKVQRAPGRIFLPEPGMSLDLGGIGKEYAVDQVAKLALAHGIQSVLVDFGADVVALGKPADGRPAWKIGLEDPNAPGQCWAGLAVMNQAVATSGDYVRRFEVNGRRYGHILDVRTGQPVNNGVRAVSVIAPSCTIAGILSTAAFVLGPVEGLQMLDGFYQAEGCLVTETGKHASRKFYEQVIPQ
ncbi:MAG: FAD:protein FMN transferase [Verrucomicrobia bacterium]|nr:FAD:protein FMN transferase [Verrucomicrobiota bacterium]